MNSDVRSAVRMSETGIPRKIPTAKAARGAQPLVQVATLNILFIMATNLDVDIAAIEELMGLGRFRSKREAVDAAVREAIAWRKQQRALDILGTIEFAAAGTATAHSDG